MIVNNVAIPRLMPSLPTRSRPVRARGEPDLAILHQHLEAHVVAQLRPQPFALRLKLGLESLAVHTDRQPERPLGGCISIVQGRRPLSVYGARGAGVCRRLRSLRGRHPGPGAVRARPSSRSRSIRSQFCR